MRELETALEGVERYYAAANADTQRVLALGTKAKIQTLLSQYGEASATLRQTEAVIAQGQILPPWHLSAYTTARLRHTLTALEHALPGRNGSIGGLRAEAKKSARQALRVANGVAGARVETWRLIGRLDWLLGRPKKACAWWRQAIAEAERLDARPELARACAEMALRAQAAQATNVDVDAHLERARSLFSEAGLAWDMAQLGDPAALARL
jgi:hypothetical protein